MGSPRYRTGLFVTSSVAVFEATLYYTCKINVYGKVMIENHKKN